MLIVTLTPDSMSLSSLHMYVLLNYKQNIPFKSFVMQSISKNLLLMVLCSKQSPKHHVLLCLFVEFEGEKTSGKKMSLFIQNINWMHCTGRCIDLTFHNCMLDWLDAGPCVFNAITTVCLVPSCVVKHGTPLLTEILILFSANEPKYWQGS